MGWYRLHYGVQQHAKHTERGVGIPPPRKVLKIDTKRLDLVAFQ